MREPAFANQDIVSKTENREETTMTPATHTKRSETFSDRLILIS